MSKIQFVIAYWLLGKIVRQGPHRGRITELFMLLRIRFEEVFTEDNQPTQAAFLRECLDDALTAKYPA